jgi:hydroxymethylbilane synthase
MSTTSGTDPGRVLRIGTRGSRLALWQAHTVSDLLQARGARCEIVVIKTTGDRSQAGPVAGDDTKRQFVKEIEDALANGDVDLAVHSAKDMTIDLPGGLTIAACLPREDPRDCLVLRSIHGDVPWPEVAARFERAGSIGTSSVRRTAQLRRLFPTVTFGAIRGNVDTRLHKLDAGAFDALVLACAGLRRLGFEDRISTPLAVERCVPAPGQGIVAIEARAGDKDVRTALASIHDARAATALTAERVVVAELDGGCKLPLGAIAVQDGETLAMHGIVTATDGSRVVAESVRGPAAEPGAVGAQLAAALTRGGARELLDEVR